MSPTPPRDYPPAERRDPAALLEELEAFVAELQLERAPPPPPRRRGGTLLIALAFAGVGLAGGMLGTLQFLGAFEPRPPPPVQPLARRLSVDVAQAGQALRDAQIRARVVEEVGAALARGTVDCAVEWRTEDGRLVTRDRVQGHTELDGRGTLYRRDQGQP